jgi:sulfate-transporting ATPase
VEGNYSSWLEQKEQRLVTEQKQEDARVKAMHKELEWVRTNPKGRQAKSKARISRFEELASYEHQKRNETQEISFRWPSVSATRSSNSRK